MRAAADLQGQLRSLNRIRHDVSARRTVFVANQESARVALNDPGLQRGEFSEVLRHDNSGVEFGAYQVGPAEFI